MSNKLNDILASRDIESVKAVIQSGIKPDKHTLDAAITTKDPEIVKLVISTGAKPSHSTMNHAIRTQSSEMVKIAIHEHAPTNPITLSHTKRNKDPHITLPVLAYMALNELPEEHDLRAPLQHILDTENTRSLDYGKWRAIDSYSSTPALLEALPDSAKELITRYGQQILRDSNPVTQALKGGAIQELNSRLPVDVAAKIGEYLPLSEVKSAFMASRLNRDSARTEQLSFMQKIDADRSLQMESQGAQR